MFLTNKVFDTLKWIAQFLLPGLATLYYALSGIWNLPYPKEVVGTIVAFSVFLGALLGITNVQYKDSLYAESKILSGYSVRTNVIKTFEKGSFPLAMTGDVYEILKWVTLILMPSIGTLYFAVSQLWNLPYGEQVVGTIAALTAFLGLMLGVSTAQYKAMYRKQQEESEKKETNEPIL